VLDAMVVDLAAMEALLITIDSDTDAIKTAVQILDDWDDSNYANVNINLAGSDAPTGGGTESGALRVTLANDSTGVISIDDGGNTITVDGTVTANVSDGSGTALTSNSGKLDVCLHSEDGTAITETSGYLNVSVRSGGSINVIGSAAGLYASAIGMEYADFDGSALPFLADIDTEGDTTPMQGSKYGVQYNMLVNEDGSKSPIDQTSGQMITTHGITGMVSGDNATISNSTAEQLDGSTSGLDVACRRVDIMAHTSNTGYIFVGDSGVVANGSGGGISLAAGDFYSIDVDNLNDIWLIATVDAENVTYNYFT